MLWSAGLEAPRKVWVHGWLLAAGGERMSKSRGNFYDPNDFVAAFGLDGARYVVLREVPFDKDAEVSWDSFIRRYNADLANDFGNLVNRTVSMVNRYLGGERPAPVGGLMADAATDAIEIYRDRLEANLLHDALASLWTLVEAANRLVDSTKPWELNKAAKAGDDAAASQLSEVLGTLVEASRLVGLAVAPFMPEAAPRILAQLGYEYPYGDDGNGGPPIMDALRWGAAAGEAGRVGTAEPLFPRLETEAVEISTG
jgi:methionyl-tRNA synthetase